MKENLYSVPKSRQVRVIIDTDAAAEADDQFAIVHALLSPKFDVVGIVAEQFGGGPEQDTMEKSYKEINQVLTKMELQNKIPVYRGEKSALKDRTTPGVSEGARFIVEEAMRQDDRPLFVVNMGAITNLASARLINPSIDEKVIAIWIGGGSYPAGHMDFNLSNDVNAANVIMESDMEMWQIPLETYTRMTVSFHELFEKVAPCGEIGKYLVDKMMQVNEDECSRELDFGGNMSSGARTIFIRTGEGWSLGDSPAVGVLVTPQGQNWETRKAQLFNPDGSYGAYVSDIRTIRVYHNMDSRVILEDFYAKLRYHFG